ncbi:MAG: glyoxalase/bleomycin resistance protein/dioxygenase [Devosia sp.]|uniref:VOC family protein n=1 Tax=Devosia sp. TaxID=1871048 RepID=UPI00262B0B20|nr:VOC family protein [Devosia sp.]MDB5527347.1 glyoxalase/bleomycin resistance protein/dioxygenase [Devosia sp.]
MHIQFSELPVTDQDRAKQFYSDALACSVVADTAMSRDGWRWIELGLPGAETNLHFIRRTDDKPAAEPVLVLVVDDVAGTVASLRHRGVDIVTEPHSPVWEPSKTVAEFRDSEGNRLVLSNA